MSIITITKENIDAEVKSAGKPVLVEFWAPWCGYCRRLSPVLDAVAGAYADKLLVGKVNVDEQVELESRYEVMTLPTLLLFREGSAGEPLVNPGSKADIDSWLGEQGVQ